ncbi:MAG TPA: type II toxin-antitoxin system HicB family antitoxin [Longimicrobium sp.]|nr:type II toxin-antitoxin system HicB family antitoxin [Longimicrobium sp.]
MPIELTAVFREVPEGGYMATVKEMPGAITQGETLEEARANLEDAVRLLIETERLVRDAGPGGAPTLAPEGACPSPNKPWGRD